MDPRANCWLAGEPTGWMQRNGTMGPGEVVIGLQRAYDEVLDGWWTMPFPVLV